MKGFKVIREDHIHHGFKYQEGLNVDPLPFRVRGSCVAGGLYFFTDIKDVVNWLDFGVYLYEVEVPEKRRYVKDPDGDKYRSKYLILKNRFDLREVSTWEYLIQQGVVIPVNYDYFLCKAARNGCIGLVKYLVSKGADIHVKNDDALRGAADRGHLEVVKYLVELGADIHVQDNYALRWSARHGHLEVVKYLVEKGAYIHTDKELSLYWAASYGHIEVVEYLKSIGAVYEGV